MQLYSYYRSTAAYRVRIALALKNINYDCVPVNLITGEQRASGYLSENPQGRVPLLVDGDVKLGQSLAIIDYLEEQYPKPSIYPAGTKARAWVRYFAQIIVSDMHPLNNSSVIQYLKNDMEHTQDEAMQWYHHWLELGFNALEQLVQDNPARGSCCWGDTPTLADICLIPQMYNADRFEFEMSAYPKLLQIKQHCLSHELFVIEKFHK